MTRINEAMLQVMARLQARRDEEGQGLVEYGLILALIAVLAVGAVTALGGSINDALGNAADALGGGGAG